MHNYNSTVFSYMKSPFFNTEIINTVTLFSLSFLHSFFKRKWNKLFFFKNIFYQLIAIQFQCSAIRNFSFQFGMKKYTFQTIFKCFYKYFPSLFIQNTIVYLFFKMLFNLQSSIIDQVKNCSENNNWFKHFAQIQT